MDTQEASPSTSPARQQMPSSGDHESDGVGSQNKATIQPEASAAGSRPPSVATPPLQGVDPISSPLPESSGTQYSYTFDEHCKCHKGPNNSGRNLVVCIDGTANQFSFKNTNVVELYSRLDKDRTQLTYYNSGIGTYVKDTNRLARLRQGIANGWDMAVAWNLKKTILDAYRWLSDNYQPGDHIFLFGFSRGAYQVRIIAGMITTVGLLHKGNNGQIEFAYELYLSNIDRGLSHFPGLNVLRKLGLFSLKKHRYSMEKVRKLTKKFKETLSHGHASVHFVGVWDTVSSVGVTRGQSFPETANGMTNVCGCRHAASLDERRGKFLPEYLNGGTGLAALQREDQTPVQAEGASHKHNRVKEVWFVGSHSDIGGGNSDNIDLDTYGPSLRWMIYESLQYGLKVKLNTARWGDPVHKPSMTWPWRILELYPFRRLTYKHRDETKRWPPHLARGRRMQEGQLIHQSVVEYMQQEANKGYTPAARGPCDLDGRKLQWDSLRSLRLGDTVPGYIEKDADFSLLVRATLTELRDKSKTATGIKKDDLQQLVMLTSKLRGGSQSIIDAAHESSELLLEALKHTAESPPRDLSDLDLRRVVRTISSTLALFPSRPQSVQSYPCLTLWNWLRLAEPSVRQKIMHVFGRTLTGHHGGVVCATWSPNGRYVASGSWDTTIRLWDTQTCDAVGEPLQHTGRVLAVAFSPDGARIASGCNDGTTTIWDVEKRATVGLPFTVTGDDRDAVTMVAFSSDNQLIMSWSKKNTVRVWNVETRECVRVSHCGESYARMVALSPERTFTATSGSKGDNTVRMWKLESPDTELRVLNGHSDWVMNVAFTPDGKRVVSGSHDGTIRVWDAESGSEVLGPLIGHGSGAVYTVAVSPNGKYIASGSHDQTVRLWNAETGQAVGHPMRGHTKIVWSLAFSPDSRSLVSGSRDEKLIIWDVDS